LKSGDLDLVFKNFVNRCLKEKGYDPMDGADRRRAASGWREDSSKGNTPGSDRDEKVDE